MLKIEQVLRDENGKDEWNKISLHPKGIVVSKDGLQGFFKYDGTIILECVWKRIEVYAKIIFAYKGKGKKRIAFDYNCNQTEE